MSNAFTEQQYIIVHDAVTKLCKHRLPLHNEKILQVEIAKILPEFAKEYELDSSSIIDFFTKGIGIEIKIKGGRREIYRQVERYCTSDKLQVLLLVTNRAMGLPEMINQTKCIVVNLGKAWL